MVRKDGLCGPQGMWSAQNLSCVAVAVNDLGLTRCTFLKFGPVVDLFCLLSWVTVTSQSITNFYKPINKNINE